MFVCSAGEGLIQKVLRIDILSPARDRTFPSAIRHVIPTGIFVIRGLDALGMDEVAVEVRCCGIIL